MGDQAAFPTGIRRRLGAPGFWKSPCSARASRSASVVEPIRIGAVEGEAVQPRRLDGAGRTILYLHGGGYYFGSSLSYRAITFALAEAARARVVAVDYRRAPEHPFPAALEDAAAAARGLYASGVSPHDLVVCGDSAGGGLALSVLTRLRDAGEPMPACAVLFSPWTDLAATGELLRRNGSRDPLFHADCIAADARHYLAGGDPRNPGSLRSMPIWPDCRRC